VIDHLSALDRAVLAALSRKITDLDAIATYAAGVLRRHISISMVGYTIDDLQASGHIDDLYCVTATGRAVIPELQRMT
jgi:hypothetical protein